MYVRWQYAERAILVENVRVDGKPKQKHIAFLGSMENRTLERFWLDVAMALDRLASGLPPEWGRGRDAPGRRVITKQELKQIVAAIQSKVGGHPPTKKELEQAKLKREKRMEALRQLRARIAARPPKEPRRKRPLSELLWEKKRLDARIKKLMAEGR